MKERTINFIIEYFYPEIGGLEKSTERLAIQLLEYGYKINVITRMIEGCIAFEAYKGCLIYRYEGDYISKAYKEGLLQQACINCVFGVGHDTSQEVWKYVFKAGIPCFIKIGKSSDMIGKGIPPEAFRGFQAILCQNPALIDETEMLKIPGLHGVRIRNGLNIKTWQKSIGSKNKTRINYQISDKYFVISAVGRFVKRKNFPMIIKSYEEFVTKYNVKNSILLLHGSDFGQHDGEESLIKRLVSEICEYNYSNIRIIPPKRAVIDTLVCSDVFITLGTAEGAPNIILEAMATGLPIIASRIPGHEVYVENNGFLVDFNIYEIADRLNELYCNEALRKQQANNSLQRAREFDIHETAKDYLRIFIDAGLEKLP